MLHSLSAQVSYYSDLIQQHKDWVYSGVFADEGISGTKAERTGFNRLIEECRKGNIDMVITKSVSRFARNTVVLLETVRELKRLGVDVFFEEQNLHSMSNEGEVMLTIVAAVAQAESLATSENMLWHIRKNFEEGRPCDGTILGYRLINGQYVIQQEEAKTVRRIFDEYIDGKGYGTIANVLNAEGVGGRFGKQWSYKTVQDILKNYTYTGNVILQKTYRENHMTKKKIKNEGQLPMYHVEEAHSGIVSVEEYEAVQAEITKRNERFGSENEANRNRYIFSGIIECGCCGKRYRRKKTNSGAKWVCSRYNSEGKKACPSKMIPEDKLYDMASEIDLENTERIVANDGNIVEFHMTDGGVIVKHWKDRSRAESWTDEMKATASRKEKERRNG